MFSYIFNIHFVILCERNSSEIVGPVYRTVYDTMIGHDV